MNTVVVPRELATETSLKSMIDKPIWLSHKAPQLQWLTWFAIEGWAIFRQRLHFDVDCVGACLYRWVCRLPVRLRLAEKSKRHVTVTGRAGWWIKEQVLFTSRPDITQSVEPSEENQCLTTSQTCPSQIWRAKPTFGQAGLYCLTLLHHHIETHRPHEVTLWHTPPILTLHFAPMKLQINTDLITALL